MALEDNGKPQMFALITPLSYWVLTILWLIILGLYLGMLRQSKIAGGAVAVLLTILSIDAFRTLFESVYFGLYFNSMFGLIPKGIYDVLSQPALIIIPKLINVFAGLLVLFLIIRRWVPRELRERDEWIVTLQQASQYLQSVIDSMPSGLIGVNSEGVVTHWNDKAVELCGLTSVQALGQPLDNALEPFPSRAAEILNAVVNQKHLELQVVPRVVKGLTRYTNIMVYPLSSNGIESAVIRLDDVTDRVRMETMMAQTEKMMSIGGLAAGMAHEINNPLSGILQGVQNVRRRLSKELPDNLEKAEELGIDFEKMQNYLSQRNIPQLFEAILESGRRTNAIIVNMLGFARRTGNEMAFVNLSELVDDVLNLAALDYDLKKSYDFKSIKQQREYASDMPHVPCVRSGIEQVLLNLLTNCAHAFQASETKIDDPEITLRIEQDGEMALIEVADNGPGMSQEVRSRVFEPFFTTKPPGKGTGLGLSVSYYIICDEHRGRMEVVTTPGQGATFRIWLPLKQEQA